MSWSQTQVTILLDEYVKHPCLYAVETTDYKNRDLKHQAMKKIKDKLDVVRPNVTISEIRTKFVQLKNTFLVEHRKYLERLETNNGNAHPPKLWYYQKLKFVLDHDKSMTSIKSINISNPNDSEAEIPCNTNPTASITTSSEDISFISFVVSKFQQINNEEIKLEVEQNITKCLFEGIRKCKNK